MTTTAIEPKPSGSMPFHDPSRRRRLKKVGSWLLGTAVAIVILHLLGVDVLGWLENLWDEIKAVPAGPSPQGSSSRPGFDVSPRSRTTAS